MQIGFLPLGCAKNGIDAEAMIRRLTGAGHSVTLTPDVHCDCVVVHTCGFTDEAKQESIDAILEAMNLRQRRGAPRRRLVVTGCLAERFGEDLRQELPEVDVVVPLAGMGDILDHVEPGRNHDQVVQESDFRLTPSHWSYLRISDGCANACAYCVIPAIRGSLVSRPAQDILSEAATRLREGCRELNVIAQDTANWGLDLNGIRGLPQLLRDLHELKGLTWLRLLYLHPAHLDEALLSTMAELPKLVHYLDLPLQHAATGILARMGRGGSAESHLQLLTRARKLMPDLTVRSAFIVGFPGETDADVTELEEFLRAARLERVAFFRYSAEEGTSAAQLDGQISEEVKQERLSRLEETQAEIAVEIESELAGEILEAMIEGFDAEENEVLLRSQREAPEVDGWLHAALPADGKIPEPGTFVRFRVDDPCPLAHRGVIL